MGPRATGIYFPCGIQERKKKHRSREPESRKVAGTLQQTIPGNKPTLGDAESRQMGPFPRSSNGNLYLLVFVDYHTPLVELFPLQKATTETISEILI